MGRADDHDGAASDLDVRFISAPLAHAVEFSVVTLVADDASYRRLLESFARNGFDRSNSEFIALDNRGRNRFDGFAALRRAAPECRGRYIVFTHDDIELIEDGAAALSACLTDLEARDPRWTLAGNAGAFRRLGGLRRRLARHISDPKAVARIDGPKQVESLDENFLVLRRDRLVLGSFDLTGFHFYAPDLCLVNEVMGGHAYVIPFLLRHHSQGTLSDAFWRTEKRFVRKFRRFFVARRFRTTCVRIGFGWRGLIDGVLDPVSTRGRRALPEAA